MGPARREIFTTPTKARLKRSGDDISTVPSHCPPPRVRTNTMAGRRRCRSGETTMRTSRPDILPLTLGVSGGTDSDFNRIGPSVWQPRASISVVAVVPSPVPRWPHFGFGPFELPNSPQKSERAQQHGAAPAWTAPSVVIRGLMGPCSRRRTLRQTAEFQAPCQRPRTEVLNDDLRWRLLA